jgi:thiamine biosynthesis lipoprotein
MDMPVVVDIPESADQKIFKNTFDYFHYIDDAFSTYKKTSEITKINNGLLKTQEYSTDMKKIFQLAAQTKKETNGYFDIQQNNHIDPSGIVKGWAIHNTAGIFKKEGFSKYYVEAGGDIEVAGTWTIGIRNPFNTKQIVKALSLTDQGIATSGTYERGNHIYNPKNNSPVTDIVSLTVIGPNVYEADRFATAAFAMGRHGIQFIETLDGFEGYMIDTTGVATMTSGFNQFIYESNR